MKKYLFILTLFIVFYSYGQQSKIDSLKKELIKVNKNEKIKLFSEINDILIEMNHIDAEKNAFDFLNFSINNKNDYYTSKAFHDLSNLMSQKGDALKSLEYAKKSLKLSDKKANVEFQIKSRINISNAFFGLYNNDSAFYYSSKALEIANNNSLYTYHSYLYLMIGRYYFDKNDYENSTLNYLEVLKFSELYKDYDIFIDACIGLSFLNIYKKDFKNAKKYALEGEKRLTKSNYLNKGYNLYKTLGKIYEGEEKIDSSLVYYLKYFKIVNSLESRLFICDASLNLSNIYLKKNDLFQAEKYAQISLNNADDMLLISSYKLLLEINIKKKDINKSNFFFNKIYNNISKSPDYLKNEIYSTFINFYDFKKDYKNKSKYLELLLRRKDSLFELRYFNNSVALEKKYQIEKKEKENFKLKQENTQKELALLKQTRNNWLLGVGLSISLLGIVTYSYFYRKTKLQKELIEDLQVELHHTVKNNLSFISSFIDITNDDLDDEKTNQKLNELKQRIESINEVHKELYEKKGETHVKMKKYISKISLLINESYKDSKVEIDQNIDESIELTPNKSFPVGLIINEFLTNSYKYAFKNITNPIIKVNMTILENHYFLELSDNGVGLPIIESSNESFGMNLMRNLTKQLEGSFLLNSQNGVQISIKFPKK